MIQDYTLDEIISHSSSPISSKHKKKVYGLLVGLREKQYGDGIFGQTRRYICDAFGLEKGHGVTVVLGYKLQYAEHVELTMNKNLFEQPMSIYDDNFLNVLYNSTKGKHNDGSILVTSSGYATNSGVLLECRPKHLLEEVGITDPNISDDRTISQKYGLPGDAGTRRLSGIAASYRMKDTTIFTLSGETGEIQVYERMNLVPTLKSKKSNVAA